MFQIVYISQAVEPMTDERLDELLLQARANNSKLSISGLLLYQDGSFIQVLEGDEKNVEETFRKIERDPRHERTQVLLRSTVEERAFEEWAMGYLRSTRLTDLPEGFHAFLERGFKRKTEQDEQAARKALLAFKEGRWRIS